MLSIAESYGAATAHRSETVGSEELAGVGGVLSIAVSYGAAAAHKSETVESEELLLSMGGAAAFQWTERGGGGRRGSCSA